jgi:Animal haem peroxidase
MDTPVISRRLNILTFYPYPTPCVAGVNTPRLAEGDVELPSARLVSQSLTESSHRASQSEIWTLMLMQWGQFLDHDITHSPIVRGNSTAKKNNSNDFARDLTVGLQGKTRLVSPAVEVANFSMFQKVTQIAFPSLSRPTTRSMPSSINGAWNSFAPCQHHGRDALSGLENR